MDRQPKYWVAVVSKDHCSRGVKGSFVQVCHGKPAPLKKMNPDDWVIVYSPKDSMDGFAKIQSFTAIGQVSDETVYQHAMTETFIPFRRNTKFYACHEAPILPLIPYLEFIKNKKSWGFIFRTGFFEIMVNDFNLIKEKMLGNGGKSIQF